MSFADNQYQQPQTSMWGDVAAQAVPNERADFIKKTYLHLLGAVLAFCGAGGSLLQNRCCRNNVRNAGK